MWLSFLTNKYVIIGAVVIAACIYIMMLRSSLSVCEAEKNVVVAELAVSQASVKSLSAAIDEQNTAIEKLKSAADERAKKNAAEVARAKAEADTFKKKANSLIARTVPQDVSKCDAANQLFNEVINAK